MSLQLWFIFFDFDRDLLYFLDNMSKGQGRYQRNGPEGICWRNNQSRRKRELFCLGKKRERSLAMHCLRGGKVAAADIILPLEAF
jgi:hypothetical protein